MSQQIYKKGGRRVTIPQCSFHHLPPLDPPAESGGPCQSNILFIFIFHISVPPISFKGALTLPYLKPIPGWKSRALFLKHNKRKSVLSNTLAGHLSWDRNSWAQIPMEFWRHTSRKKWCLGPIITCSCLAQTARAVVSKGMESMQDKASGILSLYQQRHQGASIFSSV